MTILSALSELIAHNVVLTQTHTHTHTHTNIEYKSFYVIHGSLYNGHVYNRHVYNGHVVANVCLLAPR